ncbi:MAG: hypothetical protein ACE14P_04740 [Methanotrichaceae archaeon]
MPSTSLNTSEEDARIIEELREISEREGREIIRAIFIVVSSMILWWVLVVIFFSGGIAS